MHIYVCMYICIYVLYISSSCCRSRSDKDCFHHLTVALHLSLCCESDVHESIFMSLSFRFLLMVSLNRRRGRPLFLCTEDILLYRTCFGSLSGDILMRCPVHRRFFLIRRSSIDGSPVRSSISLFVTLSIQVFLMIERRCRIMKACSFFTCRLYTVQATAPYRRVDSTIARYILPLTRMDTWWLFQSLWRSRQKDALALAILLCISSSMHPSLDMVLPR